MNYSDILFLGGYMIKLIILLLTLFVNFSQAQAMQAQSKKIEIGDIFDRVMKLTPKHRKTFYNMLDKHGLEHVKNHKKFAALFELPSNTDGTQEDNVVEQEDLEAQDYDDVDDEQSVDNEEEKSADKSGKKKKKKKKKKKAAAAAAQPHNCSVALDQEVTYEKLFNFVKYILEADLGAVRKFFNPYIYNAILKLIDECTDNADDSNIVIQVCKAHNLSLEQLKQVIKILEFLQRRTHVPFMDALFFLYETSAKTLHDELICSADFHLKNIRKGMEKCKENLDFIHFDKFANSERVLLEIIKDFHEYYDNVITHRTRKCINSIRRYCNDSIEVLTEYDDKKAKNLKKSLYDSGDKIDQDHLLRSEKKLRKMLSRQKLIRIGSEVKIPAPAQASPLDEEIISGIEDITIEDVSSEDDEEIVYDDGKSGDYKKPVAARAPAAPKKKDLRKTKLSGEIHSLLRHWSFTEHTHFYEFFKFLEASLGDQDKYTIERDAKSFILTDTVDKIRYTCFYDKHMTNNLGWFSCYTPNIYAVEDKRDENHTMLLGVAAKYFKDVNAMEHCDADGVMYKKFPLVVSEYRKTGGKKSRSEWVEINRGTLEIYFRVRGTTRECFHHFFRPEKA